MHQAIPYKSWLPLYTNTKNPLSFNTATSTTSTAMAAAVSTATKEELKGSINMSNIVQENAILVCAKRGCCMSHVVRRLLLDLGVNPPIFEIDEKAETGFLLEMEMIVTKNNDNGGNKMQLPVVFIGGQLFGGLDRLVAAHISGELAPILREAGALWL